jgi:hypothetical protein
MTQIIMEGLPDSDSSSPASLTRTVTIINEWVKVVATGVFVFIGVCLGILLIHVNTTLTKLDTTLDTVNAEAVNVETTRKSLDDLMVMATTLIIDADTAATNETNFINSTNKQLTATLGHVDDSVQAFTKNQNELTLHTVQSVDAVKTMLDTSAATIAKVQPVLDNLKIVTDSANDDLQIVNKRLADPVIGQTLANVNSMTASGASILKDGADEVHSLVHPVKKLGFWATTNAVVMYIKRFIPPLF